ncbi:hypothetical protein [Caulobacter sp. NIBR1757]|uniref:hypothetical protein n=1 Tax=Caulobacter sp. NIBR1757 TaxID=3016000 RepID=UPI0022F117E4|nr:hypothetical protein [Caulobacter sp. NIBR1757]WGM38991.1 hypothetical protein AMEJIAPC_01901 [Caulobacter sp. NIBR1757]
MAEAAPETIAGVFEVGSYALGIDDGLSDLDLRVVTRGVAPAEAVEAAVSLALAGRPGLARDQVDLTVQTLDEATAEHRAGTSLAWQLAVSSRAVLAGDDLAAALSGPPGAFDWRSRMAQCGRLLREAALFQGASAAGQAHDAVLLDAVLWMVGMACGGTAPRRENFLRYGLGFPGEGVPALPDPDGLLAPFAAAARPARGGQGFDRAFLTAGRRLHERALDYLAPFEAAAVRREPTAERARLARRERRLCELLEPFLPTGLVLVSARPATYRAILAGRPGLEPVLAIHAAAMRWIQTTGPDDEALLDEAMDGAVRALGEDA